MKLLITLKMIDKNMMQAAPAGSKLAIFVPFFAGQFGLERIAQCCI